MTREEALNEIRSWAIPSKKGREVLETLIPELAESEDEKVRKEIIQYILYKADGVSEEQEHSWITYLEKQKEQKQDSLIYDKDLDKAAREFYLSGGAASPIDSTGLVPIVRMAEFGATWMKERMEKEQKQSLSEKIRPISPAAADFLESVNGMEKNRAIGILEDYLKWAVSSEEECRYTWKELADAIQLGIDAMKARKPAEFTHHETNESLKDAVTHQMEDDGDIDDFVRKGIDDVVLKYAELGAKWQKEQQPAEWSDYKDKVNIPYCSSEPEWNEEDEKALENIRYALRYAYFNSVIDEQTTEYVMAWLKSLRPQPHWKPSEEQMEALSDAYVEASTFKIGDILESLYNDLQKLL